jgi:ABC-2 type transport system permease protein
MKENVFMHTRSILAIARKDALDLLLNKHTLVLLLTPILLAILFVVLAALIGSHTTNILVYNPGKSNVERVIDRGFSTIQTTYVNAPDQVASAFGPNGSHRDVSYALGLIVPDGFEASLQSGGHPQLSLFFDGNQVNTQQQQLLLGAINAYTRSIANPQPPVSINLSTVNPPKPTSVFNDIEQIYAIGAMLASLMIGTSIVPVLLAEEKEKKTLRMLLVSPTSFVDVVLAKLLVGFAYQFVLVLVAVAITGGFAGTQIPFILLFALLGSFLSVSVGLLVGSFVQTTSSAGAFCGIISFIYILPLFFVGPFAQLLGSSPFTQVMKVVPTYYVGDGTANAVLNTSTYSGVLLDVSVIAGTVVVLILLASWILRRQASVVSVI